MKYLTLLFILTSLCCASKNHLLSGIENPIEMLRKGENVTLQNKSFNDIIDFTQAGTPALEHQGYKRVNIKGVVTFINCTFKAAVICSKIATDQSNILCNFSQSVNFINCNFEGEVNMKGATFSGGLDLTKSHFAKPVNLESIYCLDQFRLNQSYFDQEAKFQNGVFNHQVNMMEATFDGAVSFQSCVFMNDMQAASAKFYKYADFSMCDFRGCGLFNYADFRDRSDFSNSNYGRRAEFIKANLNQSNFSSIKFYGDVNFDKAESTVKPDFTNTWILLGNKSKNINLNSWVIDEPK